MREFTHNQSFHDIDGNLLHGCVAFYKKGTTELHNIYNSIGHVLPNPVFTDSIGQTSTQVFLDDIDYNVIFYKYIGTGDMDTADVTDESKWLFQYSCLDLYDKYSIDIDVKGLFTVDTVAELRHTDPSMVSSSTLALLGYYVMGDKPMVQYYWDEENTDADNGGSIIKVEDIEVGRWCFVDNQFTEIDVRHFGAFPAISPTLVTTSQSFAIQQAYSYSTTMGSLYFPRANSGVGYYRVDTSMSDVVFDNETRIMVPTNVSSPITLELARNAENTKIYQENNYYGKVTLVGDILHNDCIATSRTGTPNYGNITLVPSKMVYIDASIQHDYSFSNIDVYFDENATSSRYSISLDNCNISGKINKDMVVAFSNCQIIESIFASDNNVEKCSFTNCASSVKSWPTISKYINYWYANGETVLDLDGRTMNASFVLTNRNVVLKNCNNSFNTQFAIGSGVSNVTIHDSNLYVTLIDGTQNVSIGVFDSNINFTGTSWNEFIIDNSTFKITPRSTSLTTNTLISTNSTIEYSSQQYKLTILSPKNVCEISHSILNVKLSTTSVPYPLIKDSKINDDIATKYIRMENNIVNGYINTTDVEGQINFEMIGNLFASGGHRVSSVYSEAIVNGKWIGNNSLLWQHFILLDRTNIALDERKHHYIYEGNTGNYTLQSYVNAKNTIALYPANAVGTLPNETVRASDGGYYCGNNLTYETREPSPKFHARTKTIDQGYTFLMIIQFFSVGITGIDFTGSCTMKGIRYSKTGTDYAPQTYPAFGTVGYCSTDEKIEDIWIDAGVNAKAMPATLLFGTGYSWYWNGWEHTPVLTYSKSNSEVLYGDMILDMKRC